MGHTEHTDMREWMEAVEAHGELIRISGASWDLEMSNLHELILKESKDPKPVVVFDDIPGYSKGYRTTFSPITSTWRIANILGLPEDQIDHMTLLQNWHNKAKSLSPVPPVLVTSGPVQDNVMTGDDIDLLAFPSPRFHELDRNRYFGTCHAVIQKDPDTGCVNLGTYRVMLVDCNHLAIHALEGQHGSILMYQKYFARGQVMPVAIAIGLDPALWWLSCRGTTPWGISEYDYAGGIKGEPIEVIEGPFTGLPLPARAEIVVEGECHPGDLVDEGPFGEWSGYYANLGLSAVPEPVIRVKAIHYRDDPILTCSHVGFPPHDADGLAGAIANSDGIWSRLEAIGIPGVKGVWCYSEAAGSKLFSVISIEQLYPGHARDVGLIAAQQPNLGRYTIVVEEDIDPSDLKQVIWALATRSVPDRSIQILHRCRSSSADPTIPPEEKRKYKVAPKPLLSSRAIIDACRGLEWKEDWYPIARISPELRIKIIEKWQSVLPEFQGR